MVLDDMNPFVSGLISDISNAYSFTNMDADSTNPAYRVRPDVEAGFSTAQVFKIPCAYFFANNAGCPPVL